MELRCGGSAPEGKDWLYAVPCRGQFIIYLPLKRLAFIGNRSMVDYCGDLCVRPGSAPTRDDHAVYRFLESHGFFKPQLTVVPPRVGEELFHPSTAVLLLTTSCNFRCVYCYASAGGERGGLLPLEAGKAAIDAVCRNALEKREPYFSLCFHGGGEPSLPESLFRALVDHARAKELPANISLSTNGFWNRGQRDWILSNIDNVSLSCDGPASVHDLQRPLASGAPSFKEVFETIREMDRRKFSYGIRLTVTRTTVDTLPGSVEFLCKETGCRSIQAEPAFDHGRARAQRHDVTDKDRFVSSFLAAFDGARRNGRTLFYSGARPTSLADTFCTAPHNALIVNNEGMLTACYEVFHSSLELAPVFFIGRIHPDNRVAIDTRARERLLSAIRQRRDACAGCFCYWHCAGDCPAKILSPDGTDHVGYGLRCALNREITKEMLVRYIHEAGGVWHGHGNNEQFAPVPSIGAAAPGKS
jgi:uncharacterized protein